MTNKYKLGDEFYIKVKRNHKVVKEKIWLTKIQENGVCVCRSEHWEILVLPSISELDKDTFEFTGNNDQKIARLQALEDSGGFVWYG